MLCTNPILVRLPNSNSLQQVACGQCACCRVNKQEVWTARIMHEAKAHKKNVFVTLTYDDEHLPKNMSISIREIQIYIKRLRKNIDHKIRYFACGEYGEEYKRPHYHLVIFGLGVDDKDLIYKCWGKGFIYTGSVELASARYTAKYVTKQLNGAMTDIYDDLGIQREFALMSRRPGLGADTADKYLDNWIQKGYVVINGVKCNIPNYYLTRLSDKGIKFKMERRLKERLLDETSYQVRLRNEMQAHQRDTNIKAFQSLKKSKL